MCEVHGIWLQVPEGHPYHVPVIGTHEDLEAATVEDVQSFFDTFYVPSNASLVVAGECPAGLAGGLCRTTCTASDIGFGRAAQAS